jgi:hypothetical protein
LTKRPMSFEVQNRSDYDIPTAVTFLLVGLAIGSFLSVLFSSAKERPSNNDRQSLT